MLSECHDHSTITCNFKRWYLYLKIIGSLKNYIVCFVPFQKKKQRNRFKMEWHSLEKSKMSIKDILGESHTPIPPLESPQWTIQFRKWLSWVVRDNSQSNLVQRAFSSSLKFAQARIADIDAFNSCWAIIVHFDMFIVLTWLWLCTIRPCAQFNAYMPL